MTDRSVNASGEANAREQVYRYLRQRITTGEYGGGIRLVEEQIAEELGVSRTPIREALQRLTSEGLVLRVRRAYLYLSAAGDFSVSQVVDIVKGVHCMIRKADVGIRGGWWSRKWMSTRLESHAV